MTPKGFFMLGVHAFENRGELVYEVQEHNKELSKEAIVTVIGNWLRSQQDDYYDSFKRKL